MVSCSKVFFRLSLLSTKVLSEVPNDSISVSIQLKLLSPTKIPSRSPPVITKSHPNAVNKLTTANQIKAFSAVSENIVVSETVFVD